MSLKMVWANLTIPCLHLFEQPLMAEAWRKIFPLTRSRNNRTKQSKESLTKFRRQLGQGTALRSHTPSLSAGLGLAPREDCRGEPRIPLALRHEGKDAAMPCWKLLSAGSSSAGQGRRRRRRMKRRSSSSSLLPGFAGCLGGQCQCSS